MNKRRVSLPILLLQGVISCVLLAGCSQTAPKPAVNTSAVVSASPGPAPVKVNSIEQCRNALNSLQTVNPQQWQMHQSAFNSLVKSASQYGSVRNGVSNGTKETVDAMYQFRTNKICADIEKDLMDGLIERGEK